MRLLLIEDDAHLGNALYQGLREEYACDWFRNAEDGEEAQKSIEYDMMVLDINLPGKTGLQMLADMRRHDNAIPVLLLTARDTILQKVEGLDAGADDYLIKPFDFDELLARIRALLRRKSVFKPTTVSHKNLEMDTVNKTVIQHGKNVVLSGKEFEILRLLVDNAGRCMSKEQIEQKIYDWNTEFESNTVEVHVSAIRRKLGKDIIKTMRGVGYIIEKSS